MESKQNLICGPFFKNTGYRFILENTTKIYRNSGIMSSKTENKYS